MQFEQLPQTIQVRVQALLTLINAKLTTPNNPEIEKLLRRLVEDTYELLDSEMLLISAILKRIVSDSFCLGHALNEAAGFEMHRDLGIQAAEVHEPLAPEGTDLPEDPKSS